MGTKLGMTQIFTEDGAVIPVTVVKAGPMSVLQVKTVETDGYNSVQVGFEDRKEHRVNKPIKGHFDKAGVSYKRYVREFLVDNAEEFKVGDEITLEAFADGDIVDVMGTSKGKGTQGTIKRHNFSRGPETHGSKYHRAGGARSAAAYPGRVFKGNKGTGRMGAERVTVQNLEIVKVDAERGVLLIKGAIPGPKNGLVVVSEAVKAR